MAAGGEWQLAGGRVVVPRPAGPGDVAAIARLYRELSPESFRRRFCTGQPRPELVERFASLDRGAVGIVAAPSGESGCLAGEARYVPIGSGTAELALTIRDGYQHAGLGQLLLAALVARAREDGLARLRAVVLLANAR